MCAHPNRQSKKLADDQLKELQKMTNFDKKELQQWYRGMYLFAPFRDSSRA
jgi:hypothetical protein